MNNKFLRGAVLFIIAFVLSNLASLAQVKAQTNTFYGDGAGHNTTGGNDSAFGFDALYYNTSGNGNTASGSFALGYNTTGNNNTASGFHALLLNTTGNYNTASGYQSLFSNTSGVYKYIFHTTQHYFFFRFERAVVNIAEGAQLCQGHRLHYLPQLIMDTSMPSLGEPCTPKSRKPKGKLNTMPNSRPTPTRSRKRYDPQRRLEVAETRRNGACTRCREKKVRVSFPSVKSL